MSALRHDPRVRLAVVLVVGLVPWSVQRFTTGELFLRFAWGGVSFRPALTARLLWGYPPGVPLVSRWLIATGCWVAALVSAIAGVADREDRRLTAGLLVIAGLANALVAVEFGVQPARVGYPVGSVVAVAAAGWLW